MQRLEISGAVRHIYTHFFLYISLGGKGLSTECNTNIVIIRIMYVMQCVRKVAVHLYKVLEVMSTSFYTGLSQFNFIRKHFLQICV
jgi:hypothetical protein